MADTVRTEAELLALIPPESSFVKEGDTAGTVPTVTPQDIRDIVVSLFSRIDAASSMAAYYVSSAAATEVAAQGTDLKASGTTAAIGTATSDLTVATTNRITYGGTTPRTFHVTAVLITTCAADAKSLTLSLYKTGAAITGIARTYTHATGATQVVTVLQGLVSLAATDYLEIWVANETDAEDITIAAGSSLTVVGLS